MLATYYQPQLKYVTTGIPAEVALDAYPGQIFKGAVEAIWKTNAQGQYLPSDVLPTFTAEDPHSPRGEFAVKIVLSEADQGKVSIGTHGVTAIYTSGFGGRGRCCAGSPSAATPGSTGSTRSASEAKPIGASL